jgi:outer membrane protein OmpA-like peptidoglycan-associated protein
VAGPQGPVGATGAQGPVGSAQRWTLFRDFYFENNRSTLSHSQEGLVLEIASYIKENPSVKIAVDGSLDGSRSQELSDRRSRSIRDALIKAGVPAENIQIGAYGDKKLMHDSRTSVLLRGEN